METLHKIDLQRRLCIKKDLDELNLWITILELFNKELDSLSIIEKQLIRNSSVEDQIKVMRRKNVLVMASLCKYEQELKRESDYGKEDYDASRLKLHDQKRDGYLLLLEDQRIFKDIYYASLKKFKQN